MAANYQPMMTRDTGEDLALLDNFLSIDYVKVVGAVGSFVIRVPGHLSTDILRQDNQLRIFRETPSLTSHMDFVGLLRSWEFTTASDGAEVTKLMGPDLNDLVRRRIVAYASGSINARTSVAFVDDSMKDLASENLGSGATDTTRDLTGNGFGVQGDDSVGPDVQAAFSWRNLQRVLDQLSDSSRTAGSQTFWFIIPTGIDADGTLQFQFQTAISIPGADRSWDPVIDRNPMVFGLDHGNLSDPSLLYDYSGEINYVYVGGNDQGEAREIVERSDQARIDVSIFNRIETFVNASQDSSGDLAALGDAELAEGRPRVRFTGKLLSNEQTPYGEWGLGDLVTIDYIEQFNALVRMVNVRVTEGGIEDIWGSAEFESAL